MSDSSTSATVIDWEQPLHSQFQQGSGLGNVLSAAASGYSTVTPKTTTIVTPSFRRKKIATRKSCKQKKALGVIDIEREDTNSGVGFKRGQVGFGKRNKSVHHQRKSYRNQKRKNRVGIATVGGEKNQIGSGGRRKKRKKRQHKIRLTKKGQNYKKVAHSTAQNKRNKLRKLYALRRATF